ncbi:MAG TPA: NAD-binding protein, partial [Streptosporangiaceae bacterium]|nr:NAD-binding protein [Streptosporangiaceae bacterium]
MPAVAAISATIFRSSSAQVAKAVNNLILWACLVADHEGLALAQRYGVDTAELRTALLGSSAANTALSNWGKQTMAWAEDDLKIVAEMAATAGITLPQAGVNR